MKAKQFYEGTIDRANIRCLLVSDETRRNMPVHILRVRTTPFEGSSDAANEQHDHLSLPEFLNMNGPAQTALLDLIATLATEEV